MFRPSLGHLQALKEHKSKIIQFSYINTLWDLKCSQKCYKKYCVTLKYTCVWILRFVVTIHNIKIKIEFIY